MWLSDAGLFHLVNAGVDAPKALLTFATFVSSTSPLLVGLGLVAAAVIGRPGMRAAVSQAFIAMALAWLAVQAIRRGFPAPRPAALGEGLQWMAHGRSSSFPSHHAAGAFACFWALAGSVRLRQRLAPGVTTACFLVAVLIAWSRVYLGLHFPSDIAVGALLGLGAAWATHAFWVHTQYRYLLRLRATQLRTRLGAPASARG